MKHEATRTIQHTEESVLASRNPSRDDLCQFPFSDGRACRMPLSPTHSALCVFHARSERELLSADYAARQLASPSGEFKTASDVNHVLGNLFHLVAQNRIPRRDAVALAYIGQLLLQGLPHVRDEIRIAHGYGAWNATVQNALANRDSESDDEPGDESPVEAEASA